MSENEQKDEELSPAEALKRAQEAAVRAEQAEEGNPEQSEEQPEVLDPAASEALIEAQAKAAETYDLYVRACAEMENIRRRSAEDVVKAQKFGVEKFAKNLLPVVDSLEKALEAAKDAEGPMKEGMEVTYKQLLHALDLSGMTPISAKGEKFDPAFHQAIVMVPAAEGQMPGTVAAVFQTGWKIHERVLRPAMVSVVQG
ncbi:MAG: nucleotide exchange factor GrpE [Duodenibacillus sp.]|nr:nucleotide exchange factor GrpE [Duodenibacillus sp.]HBC70295.1 nucleotide exchange factor GrpE [Sutterella sp.]